MTDRPVLDLHGARTDEALARVRRWLADLQARDVPEAELITGWGRHTPQGHRPGALRRAVRALLDEERRGGRLQTWHELAPGRFFLRLAPRPGALEARGPPPLGASELAAAEQELADLGVRPTPETLAAWARRRRSS